MPNKTNHIRTGKYVPCRICGKQIYRKGYLLKKFKVFYCSKQCKGKDSYIVQKGIKRQWLDGENNHEWKGDGVGYQALHDWIRRKNGKPMKCEKCGTIKASKYEWANKDGKYKRNINDWIGLCTKCHNTYDKTSEKMKKIRKEKFWSTKKKNI